MRATRNRVYGNPVTGVQIPPHPPKFLKQDLNLRGGRTDRKIPPPDISGRKRLGFKIKNF